MSYLRLRQICLIARDLEATRQSLCDTFGIEVCNRDPNVEQHGLKNVVLPIGSQFLEVVSPFREGTTGGRYLDRLGGDGGYMAILDCNDLDQRRKVIEAAGVRIARFADYSHEGYRALHLHPKDTGGTLLSVDEDKHGDDPEGAWHPAGPDWKAFRKTGRVLGIAGVEIQSPDPKALAARWSAILERRVETIDGVLALRLDGAAIRFAMPRDGRGETLSGVDLKAAPGFSQPGGVITVCGIRFNLVLN